MEIVHSHCESFSDNSQKIWDKLGVREIDDSMWTTLFMNVNKISIAKEILETKLKSPTLRSEAYSSLTLRGKQAKDRFIKCQVQERDGRLQPQLEKFSSAGFCQEPDHMLCKPRQICRAALTPSLNFPHVRFLQHGNKLVGFG